MSTKAIYKYELSMGENKLKFPHGSIILSAKEQYNKVVIYLMVDTELKNKAQVTRNIYCTTTGTEIHDYDIFFTYIDTVMLNSGSFVVHVFEIKP